MFSRSPDYQPSNGPSAIASASMQAASAVPSSVPAPITLSAVAPPTATIVPASDSRATPSKVSVIGNDLTILGQGITIISKGSLQLDGAIQGNLHGTEILVGEKGSVEGTISAQSVVIRGTVNGSIRALRVALQEGAHVEGEIHHQTLVLDAKAHFEGKVRRPANPDELMPKLDPAMHDSRQRVTN